jgi:hypothetical protein
MWREEHAFLTKQTHFIVDYQRLNDFGKAILSHFKPFFWHFGRILGVTSDDWLQKSDRLKSHRKRCGTQRHIVRSRLRQAHDLRLWGNVWYMILRSTVIVGQVPVAPAKEAGHSKCQIHIIRAIA